MELRARTVALYGRFTSGVREALAAEIATRGGRVIRDLTARADVLVIGARAEALIASGALLARLETARRKGKVVLSESEIQSALNGEEGGQEATIPITTAIAQSGSSEIDVAILGAFGLIKIRAGYCRFGDVATLKTASRLREAGCSLVNLVRILREAAAKRPIGRSRIVFTETGEPALQWEDGVTTLAGQGYLPLNLAGGHIDDLFEAAALSEAEGNLEEAARLFDMCARADKADAIALFNHGNIRLKQNRFEEAALAYQRALARDDDLDEARYNLALSLEALGKKREAESELRRLLQSEPDNADALYNLAQLLLEAGRPLDAAPLFERFLLTEPEASWATRARKALAFCRASGSEKPPT